MKNITLLLITILLGSCTTTKNPDGTSSSNYNHGMGLSAAAAATSGALAYELTDNKSNDAQLAWTAGTALTTFAFGEYVRGQVELSMEEKYALGYKAGQADTTKNQYELIQNLQRGSNQQKVTFRTYEFPGVTERNGVNLDPHTVKVRIQE